MCSADKKMGLQLSEKVKISPWDILEGFKNPAPLSWAWFGSVKHDRKPLRMEEAFAELKYVNTASVEKKKEYFLEPPPLPQEDLEQNATAAAKEIKPEEEHKNQILQNLPSMVPSPMGPQGQGQNQNKPTRGPKHNSVPDSIADKMCDRHYVHADQAWYCLAPTTCPWKDKCAAKTN